MTAEAKANILLVDDRPENILALEAVLADLGQNLVKADSGRQALRCVLEQDFAVILLDVQMPGMDGFETAALIRERERSMHTPIVFLTANDQSEPAVFRGYSVGAVDYLFKPYIPGILKSKVAVFVNLFQMRERVRQQAEQLTAINQSLAQEITERKRVEEELQKYSWQLEAANRELEAFSYSVSHDLRAPLRSIEGFSRALLEDCGDKLDVAGKDSLQRVCAASQNMAQLIDALLALSQVASGEMQRESVNLSALARTIEGELRKTEPDRHVEFFIQEGLVVNGDTRLLRVMLENLLGNAWKYTSKHPCARIELGVARQADGTQAYFVRDDGAGFDTAFVNKLFGAFQRLHPDSEFKGTGIGLATVQRIVHLHGGRVWADGAVERGASFYFTL